LLFSLSTKILRGIVFDGSSEAMAG
jgi:hypothetical protein